MSPIQELWPHQATTKQFLLDNPIVYDASDPGVGKTRAHLEAFAERRAQGGGRALVVAPLSLLTTAWGGDAAKFIPGLKVAYAFAGKRKEAFESGADIVCINTDGVKWIVDTPHAVRLLAKFDTIIIDEIPYFKHRTSARSRAMRKIAPRFKYRVGLSGTMRSNSVLDLWHQILLLDNGARLGVSFTRFRNQFCTAEHNGFAWEWHDKPRANRVAMHLLRDITVRHRFDEVMDVPPNYTRIIPFQLSSKLRKAYLEMEQEAILALKSGDVSAVNAAALRTKLLQICSGAVYGDDGKAHLVDTFRYELVLELVKKRDHSIVFFNWAHQRDELCKLAKKEGIAHEYMDGTVSHARRTRIVDAFQAGAHQVLFLQPETGAHGLTLTRGRATIWASPQYKPDVAKQGLHRIYRGGQKHKTETILIEAQDTVEQAVNEKLQNKTDGMVGLLDMIEQVQRGREKR